MSAISAPRRNRVSGLRLGLRLAMLALAGVIALPVILVPLYAFVDPVSMPMLARHLTGQRVVREWRGIDTISDRLKASVVMSEDGQFCQHWGVDFGALRSEVDDLFAGRPVRGASTISMQVARNLFLWNARSYIRKVLEIPLALYIDLVLSKRRIMEIYLNIAEWGPDGEFGIAAGARTAFVSDASQFSWRNAALLAVSITNPHIRFAAKPSARMGRIATIVERRARGGAPWIGCLYESGQIPPDSL